MNRETILSASDEQLNLWCAEKVMQWRLEKGADFSDGSVSFPDMWRKSDGQGTWSKRTYTPTTDIAQAIALLDKLREQWELWWVLRSDYDTIGVEIWNPNIKGDNPVIATHFENGLNMTRTIVIASLLAIAEMEAHPVESGG